MLYILTNSSTSESSTAILHDLKNEVYPLHGLQHLHTVLLGCYIYLSCRFYRYPPKIPLVHQLKLVGRRDAAGSVYARYTYELHAHAQ